MALPAGLCDNDEIGLYMIVIKQVEWKRAVKTCVGSVIQTMKLQPTHSFLMGMHRKCAMKERAELS